MCDLLIDINRSLKTHFTVHVHVLNKGYINNARGYIRNYINPTVDAIKEQIKSGATNVNFY